MRLFSLCISLPGSSLRACSQGVFERRTPTGSEAFSLRPLSQDTKNALSQSLILEPLVNGHLPQATATTFSANSFRIFFCVQPPVSDHLTIFCGWKLDEAKSGAGYYFLKVARPWDFSLRTKKSASDTQARHDMTSRQQLLLFQRLHDKNVKNKISLHWVTGLRP